MTEPSSTALARVLRDAISSHTASVGVIGLGYVGLPLALTFVEEGFEVLGFDVDQGKIDALGRGECYIKHLDVARLAAARAGGRLDATSDFRRLSEPDAILICVPTPLTAQREPDMSHVDLTARQVSACLRRGQLVVLESTTYPGTTDERVRGILEESGLRCGEDFFLAFSPEREDPGNPDFGTSTIPKVVGGVDEISGDLAQALYDQAVASTVRVSSARAAEATKLMENIFRAVNIALVNELKVVYDRMGIDIWEVLDAAATKPFGFMRFDPGPGWGGHCLRGDQWVRVRGRGLNGPYRIGELFASLRDRNPVLATKTGLYLEPSGLEALGLDPSSGAVGWFSVTTLFRAAYKGRGFKVFTQDHAELVVTEGHPMLVQGDGGFHIVLASGLGPGDALPVASDFGNAVGPPRVDLLDAIPADQRNRVWVRIRDRAWGAYERTLKQHFGWTIRDAIRSNALRLDRFLDVERELGVSRDSLMLLTGMGRARRSWHASVILSPDFARIVGYYLAEGCITHDRNAIRVRFTFNRDETEAIEDLRSTLARHGFPSTVYQDATWHTTTIKVSSLLLGWLLGNHWRCGVRSEEMRIPDLIFGLSPDHKRELLSGLLRGDGDVWTRYGKCTYRKNGRWYSHHNSTAVVGFFSSSPVLLEQVVHLLHDAGFRPRFKVGKPQIRMQGVRTVRALGLLLCDAKRRRLEAVGEQRRREIPSLSDSERLTPEMFVSRVIRKDEIDLDEPVYSLEVAGSGSFATNSGIVVHNCIPLDPFYLSWKAREYGVAPKFIELAGDINVEMPRYVVEKLQTALNERGRAVKGSKVLVLGLAYKKDIDDPRESPAFEIIERLLHLGAEVGYHDPHIPVAPRMRTWPHLPPMLSLPLTPATIAAHDAVVIITNHSAVDYAMVATHAPLIVDTRGVYRGPRPNVVKA